MGANAQTTVPTFTSGQVLTAAQQNASARTGVPVFATTTTRDAAFGGSNKALAEGQLCYIEATDVVQYYDGSAWATLAPIVKGISSATVTTSQSIGTGSNNVYQDLATVGPTVTVTTGTTAIVIVTCSISGNDNNTNGYMSFAVSGATTIAVSDSYALSIADSVSGNTGRASTITYLTTLTPGSNTFTAKYKHRGDVGISTPTSFADRNLIVVTL